MIIYNHLHLCYLKQGFPFLPSYFLEISSTQQRTNNLAREDCQSQSIMKEWISDNLHLPRFCFYLKEKKIVIKGFVVLGLLVSFCSFCFLKDKNIGGLSEGLSNTLGIFKAASYWLVIL